MMKLRFLPIAVCFIFYAFSDAAAFYDNTFYASKIDAIVVVFSQHNSSDKTDKAGNPERSLTRQLFSDNGYGMKIQNPLHTFTVNDEIGSDSVYSSGTGFIIQETGLVVTNYHIVRGAEAVIVELSDGQQFLADVVGADKKPENDIALLKIRTDRKFSVLKLAIADTVSVGMQLMMIGHPYLYIYTAAHAIVSRRFIANAASFIQIQSSILPGNSGSPLLNRNGEAVGIVFAAIGDSETQGLAIPAVRIQAIIDKILNRPATPGP